MLSGNGGFDGGTDRPLRVALLCSHRAPGLHHLLEEDRSRGDSWQLVCCLSSESECADRATAESHGIPFITHDIHAWCAARGVARSDRTARSAYDRETIERLLPFEPDLLVLCGYLYVVTRPLLERYPDSILNIHDSDLCLHDETGRPRYRGLRSTRDAIVAGEGETRSTVHVVTEEVDVGPVIVRSAAFPVHTSLVERARGADALRILKAYAYAQREWMMLSWGPLLSRAIGARAGGRVLTYGPTNRD